MASASSGSDSFFGQPGISNWEQKMIEVGCVHHGVLIHDAKVADALAMFCKFMGIEAVRGA